MNREQRTSAPLAIFSRPESQRLTAAVNWLTSEGIIVRTSSEWTFLHQTFFDYCYARQFVEDDGNLSEAILRGDQGLFARRQLVQVLAYLRGSDPRSYIRELNNIFGADDLRFHLKELLFSWFGTLPDPMDDEWLLARKLLADHEARSRLLKAMQGNPGWFVRLRGGTIQNLLREDGEVADGVMLYLGTMIKVEQEDVVDLLRPFVGQSSRWNERIDWMLDRMLEWRTLAAVELFGQLLQEISASEAGNLRYLDKAVKAYPWEGCRLIRLVLDRSLEAYIASGGSTVYRGLLRAMPLHDYTLSEALKAASKEAPSEFVPSCRGSSE